MPISNIGPGSNPVRIENREQLQSVNNSPREMRARPSGLVIAARVIGGIATVGISEGIIALARHFSSKNAPAPRVVAPQVPLSRPADDMNNHELAVAIRREAGLPGAHQAALDEAVRSAVRDFDPGRAGGAPETLPRSAARNVTAALAEAVCNAPGLVTPAELKELARGEAARELAKGAFEDKLRALLAERHVPAGQVPSLSARLMESSPDFQARLLACGSRAQAEAVIAENMPAIGEAVQIAADNYAVSHALMHRDWSSMDPASRESLAGSFDRICDALRGSFGKANVPEGAKLFSLLSAEDRTAVARQIRAGARAVTPEELKEMVIARFAKAKAETLLMANIRAACGQEPCPQQMQREVMESILGNYKIFAADLEKCRDLKSIAGLIAGKSRLIGKRTALHQQISRQADAAFGQALQALAGRAGMSRESLAAVLNTAELKEAFAALSRKMAAALRPDSPEDMQAAFSQAAGRFVESKAGLLESVSEMPLTEEVRNLWKTAALSSRSLTQPDMLQKAWQAAAATDARSLISALRDAGSFAPGEIFGLMQSVALRLSDNLQGLYGAENWNALGKDAQAELRGFAVKALLSMAPKLTEALAAQSALFSDFTVRNENSALVAGMLTAADEAGADEAAATLAQASETVGAMLSGWPVPNAEYNRQIAAAVLNPADLPREYALALGEAAARIEKRFGADALPGGSFQNLLQSQSALLHSSLGEQLSMQIRADGPRLTSARLAELFAQTAQRFASYSAFVNQIAQKARDFGKSTDSEDLLQAVRYMFADTRAAVRGHLDSARDSQDITRLIVRMDGLEAFLRGQLPDAPVKIKPQAAAPNGGGREGAAVQAPAGNPQEDVRPAEAQPAASQPQAIEPQPQAAEPEPQAAEPQPQAAEPEPQAVEPEPQANPANAARPEAVPGEQGNEPAAVQAPAQNIAPEQAEDAPGAGRAEVAAEPISSFNADLGKLLKAGLALPEDLRGAAESAMQTLKDRAAESASCLTQKDGSISREFGNALSEAVQALPGRATPEELTQVILREGTRIFVRRDLADRLDPLLEQLEHLDKDSSAVAEELTKEIDGFLSCANRAEIDAKLDELAAAAMKPLQAADRNAGVADTLVESLEIDSDLPEELVPAGKEISSRLNQGFGLSLNGSWEELDNLIRLDAWKNIAGQIRGEKDGISAERLTQLTVAAYARRVAVSELRAQVKNVCAGLGFEAQTSSEIIARLLENREFSSALLSCTDRGSIGRVIGENGGFISREIQAIQKEATSALPGSSRTGADALAVRRWISENLELTGPEREAVMSAAQALNKRWGTFLAGADLSGLPDAKAVKGALLALALEKGDRLTPEDLKRCVLAAGGKALARQALLDLIKEKCEFFDLDHVPAEQILAAMEKLHPQALSEQLACRDKAEFEEARLLEFQPLLDSCLTARRSNASLASALGENDLTKVPEDRREAFSQAIEKTVADLRGQFGPDLVPEGAALDSLLSGSARRALSERVLAEPLEVTPEILARFIAKEFAEQAQLSILEARVAEICKQSGGDGSNAAAIRDLMLRNKPFAGKLLQLSDKAAIDEYLASQDKFIRWEVGSSLQKGNGKAGNFNEELSAAFQSGGMLPTLYQLKLEEALESASKEYGADLLADERSAETRDFKLAVQAALASRSGDAAPSDFSDIVLRSAYRTLNMAALDRAAEAFHRENRDIAVPLEKFRALAQAQNGAVLRCTSAAEARRAAEEAVQYVAESVRTRAKIEQLAAALERGDLSGLDEKMTGEISALVSSWQKAFPSAGIAPGAKLEDIFSSRQMAQAARLIRDGGNYSPTREGGLANALQYAFIAKIVIAPLKERISAVADDLVIPMVSAEAENKIIRDFLKTYRSLPSKLPATEEEMGTDIRLYSRIDRETLSYSAPAEQVPGSGAAEGGIDLFAPE